MLQIKVYGKKTEEAERNQWDNFINDIESEFLAQRSNDKRDKDEQEKLRKLVGFLSFKDDISR